MSTRALARSSCDSGHVVALIVGLELQQQEVGGSKSMGRVGVIDWKYCGWNWSARCLRVGRAAPLARRSGHRLTKL
jgi:hypothetical protein